MEQAVTGSPAVDVPVASTPPSSTDAAPRRARDRRLWLDLTILGVVGLLLFVAAAAAMGAMYRSFYSPAAFVERYLQLLSDGRAAEALVVPGVAVDSVELEAAGLPPTASDALLRRAAMAALGGVRVVAESQEGDTSLVTVEYQAGDFPDRTTFEVERDGWLGVAPTWRFATSPLAVLELTVTGSRSFEVNGFEVDQRQVSPDGIDADPLAPVALLVFSPGIYSVSVDTAISSTPGVAVLSDSPFTAVPVSVQAQPTDEFVAIVQHRVEEFLTDCATQEVLQPTACPFGYPVQDRIVSPPVWSIARQPVVALEPDGDGWKIPATEAVAHIEVDIRSLFDGSVRHVSEDVPFSMTGTITVLPDGTASISLSGIDTR